MRTPVLVILGLALFSRICLACSCIGPPFRVTESGERPATPLERVALKYYRADAVFLGHVAEVRPIALKDFRLSGDLGEKYHIGEETHFQVLKSWKGDPRSQIVMRDMQLTSCAISFEPDKDYLVYARWGSFGTYATGFCSTTRTLNGLGSRWYGLEARTEIDLLDKFAPFESLLSTMME